MSAERTTGAKAGLAALVPRGGLVKAAYTIGTHRTVAPDVTVERWSPHLAEFGITRLAELTGLDVIGLPVVQAVRPNGRSLSVAQGKGVSLAAARASALMEGAELWHAEHHRLPLRRASWRDLARDSRVLDIGRIPRRTAVGIDRDKQLSWARGLELFSGDPVWVPEQLVSMDFTSWSGPATEGLVLSSNGLASGNHVVEAAAHALFELIERDAFALVVARNRFPDAWRRIDPATIDDDAVRVVLDRCAAAEVFVALMDITSDIGIPAVSCVLFDHPPKEFRRLPTSVGHGCHVDRSVAVSRALTEAIQSRLTVIAGSRDDMKADDYGAKRWSNDAAAWRAQLVDQRTPHRFDDLPRLSFSSIDHELDFALQRLAAVGLDEAVLVDLTIDSIGLPVTRVLVPGLEHWEAGLTHGARIAGVLRG